VRLYNTLTRRLEELPPPPGPIRMYFCGPTVYARAHIGNAIPFVLPMWLGRWLRLRGYDVTFVHNITDVDDKILEAPGPSADLAAQAAEWYLQDVADLGLGMPDAMPRATRSIPQIIAFIERLVATDHAYAVGGDVYFRVACDPEYGRLSGQRPDQVAEQEPNPLKEDGRDFALWKGTKDGEDISFDSPWGPGRPGWHIECSAMAEDAFGPVFEIHGGGLDLVFPHHENELAQSHALGHEFAHIWMHNGMLRFTGEKMSKSLGNVATIREVLDEYGRETVLLFIMTGHWRKPLDFSGQTMAQAAAQVESLRNVFRSRSEEVGDWAAFEAALEDDFNTPEALALMHGWRDHELLRRGLDVFGLASLAEEEAAPSELVALAEQRQAARAGKDFAEADRLRDEIAAAGWEVRDEAGGFRLVRA
jgi:cysteinyl-tRNA synthetase